MHSLCVEPSSGDGFLTARSCRLDPIQYPRSAGGLLWFICGYAAMDVENVSFDLTIRSTTMDRRQSMT